MRIPSCFRGRMHVHLTCEANRRAQANILYLTRGVDWHIYASASDFSSLLDADRKFRSVRLAGLQPGVNYAYIRPELGKCAARYQRAGARTANVIDRRR